MFSNLTDHVQDLVAGYIPIDTLPDFRRASKRTRCIVDGIYTRRKALFRDSEVSRHITFPDCDWEGYYRTTAIAPNASYAVRFLAVCCVDCNPDIDFRYGQPLPAAIEIWDIDRAEVTDTVRFSVLSTKEGQKCSNITWFPGDNFRISVGEQPNQSFRFSRRDLWRYSRALVEWHMEERDIFAEDFDPDRPPTLSVTFDGSETFLIRLKFGPDGTGVARFSVRLHEPSVLVMYTTADWGFQRTACAVYFVDRSGPKIITKPTLEFMALDMNDFTEVLLSPSGDRVAVLDNVISSEDLSKGSLESLSLKMYRAADGSLLYHRKYQLFTPGNYRLMMAGHMDYRKRMFDLDSAKMTNNGDFLSIPVLPGDDLVLSGRNFGARGSLPLVVRTSDGMVICRPLSQKRLITREDVTGKEDIFLRFYRFHISDDLYLVQFIPNEVRIYDALSCTDLTIAEVDGTHLSDVQIDSSKGVILIVNHCRCCETRLLRITPKPRGETPDDSRDETSTRF